MEWTIVVSLVAVGLFLLLVEILFVPGTTLVGLVGFIVLGVGVGLSFKYFGREVGWMTLGGTSVVAGLTLYFSFKSNLWSRFALKSAITSKVNEDPIGLSVGEEGVALSALRPIGKAEIGKRTFEVKTLGAYVETGKRIRIIQIISNQIIVEPLS
jgi:membrane-bound ClpP family serine protease